MHDGGSRIEPQLDRIDRTLPRRHRKIEAARIPLSRDGGRDDAHIMQALSTMVILGAAAIMAAVLMLS